MPLLERFQELNRERLPLTHRYLVGYSGGPDSTALLHLMVRAGYEVVAAHLHHGMRPEADEEANRAETWAKSLGIQILIGHADVPTISTHRKIGLEEAGREARYEFFVRHPPPSDVTASRRPTLWTTTLRRFSFK